MRILDVAEITKQVKEMCIEANHFLLTFIFPLNYLLSGLVKSNSNSSGEGK